MSQRALHYPIASNVASSVGWDRGRSLRRMLVRVGGNGPGLFALRLGSRFKREEGCCRSGFSIERQEALV